MKILLTSPYYPPHIGGIEIHTMNLARGLKGKGHSVEVISSTGEDEVVKVVTVPCIPVPYSPIPLKFPKVNGDIYHSHIPSPFFAKNIHAKNCKPHIVTYHNDVFVPERVDGRTVPRFSARWIENKNEEIVEPILSKAEVIIATTRSYAETSPVLSNYMGKVEIIPNAIRVEDYQPGIDAGLREKIILYVGRLVEYKGLMTLIRAARNLRGKIVVIGDGEDRIRFEEASRKPGVDVEFKGRTSFSELKSWMRKARILVLPSKSRLEAFGIVLLEAMACKTPVIASKIPGVEEIGKEGGFVFDSEKELSYLLSLLLEDDNLATKLGRRGRKRVIKKYDWDIILDKIEKLYMECS